MTTRSRQVLLGLAVSVLAAAVLVATMDFAAVVERLRQAQLAWLLLALPVLGMQAWSRATRWASVVTAACDRPVRATHTLDAMLVGYFVNAVAPGRLGELARSVIVSRREALAFSAIAASVVVERVIDVMALAGLAAVALAASGSDWWAPFAAIAAAIAFVGLLGSRAQVLGRLLPRRMPVAVAAGVRTFLAAVAAIRLPVTTWATALSAVAWCGDALLVLLVSRALGLAISPAAAIVIGLGGSLGTALPAAPGYLATYELGAVALGAFAGVPRETILPIAILTHVAGVVTLATAGALSLGRLGGMLRLDGLLRGNGLTAVSEES